MHRGLCARAHTATQEGPSGPQNTLFTVRVAEPWHKLPTGSGVSSLGESQKSPGQSHLSRGLEKVTFTGTFPQPLLGSVTGSDTAKPRQQQKQFCKHKHEWVRREVTLILKGGI